MQLIMKIKVMLVEDEPIIRHSIREQINRLDHEFLVTAEAENGAQALELLQQQEPDVLITDIRMPEIDGVELIRRVRLRYPKIKVIILSGYSDFSYTQQAIRYGVSYYLLKPVEDEALRETLIELKSELLREQYQPSRTVTKSSNYREHTEQELKYALMEVCVGNLYYDISDQYIQDYYNDLPPLNWARMMVGLMEDLVDWQVTDEEAPNQKLVSCRFSEGSKPAIAEAAKVLALRINQQWPGIPVTISYSRCLISKDEVWMCSQRLRNLLRQALLPARGSLLCLEEDELRYSDELLSIARMRVNDQLRQSIEKNDEQQIKGELEMIMKYMVDHGVPQRDIQKIITHIIHLCELYGKDRGEIAYKRIMRVLTCAEDPKVLPHQLVSSIMQNFWQSETQIDLGTQLVEYVDRHYVQLENLESLTEVFHYNYAYLSRLFKRQTGVPINRYVLEKRLDLAKQLIENNEALNIMQISSLAGFSDRRYFLRAFKSYTGQSPTEYKNSIILKG